MSTITLPQRHILDYLSTRKAGATLREINTHLGVTTRNIAHINRLTDAGHITHVREVEAARYSITPRGRRALSEALGEGSATRTGLVPPRTHHRGGDYLPDPWRPEVARPGCLDNVNIPSLMGSRRVYRRDAAGVPA